MDDINATNSELQNVKEILDRASLTLKLVLRGPTKAIEKRYDITLLKSDPFRRTLDVTIVIGTNNDDESDTKLRNGDRIEQVNGKNVNKYPLKQLREKLVEDKELSLKIVREESQTSFIPFTRSQPFKMQLLPSFSESVKSLPEILLRESNRRSTFETRPRRSSRSVGSARNYSATFSDESITENSSPNISRKKTVKQVARRHTKTDIVPSTPRSNIFTKDVQETYQPVSIPRASQSTQFKSNQNIDIPKIQPRPIQHDKKSLSEPVVTIEKSPVVHRNPVGTAQPFKIQRQVSCLKNGFEEKSPSIMQSSDGVDGIEYDEESASEFDKVKVDIKEKGEKEEIGCELIGGNKIGIYIDDVAVNSIADRNNIKRGWRILKINEQSMNNVALCYAYEYFLNQERKTKMTIHFEMVPV